MGVKDLSLEVAYRSASHRIGRDFFGSLLSEATRYDRAAAFFSSTCFAVASEAVIGFAARGGRMRLVCSPVLHAADVAALSRAIFNPAQVLREEDLAEALRSGRTASALARLVAEGTVDVRIAVTPRPDESVYHEKIGLFYDGDGSYVAFSGSSNESRTAWVQNFERVDVFASWAASEDRVRSSHVRQNFEDLWHDRTRGVRVVDLAEAIRGRLLTMRPTLVASTADAPDDAPRSATVPIPEVLRIPGDLVVKAHQQKAIERWAKAGGRGLLEMATGSGKTITALVLAARMWRRMTEPLVIVIVAPYIHLVDQWIAVSRTFGLRPIRCAEGRDRWVEELRWAIHAVASGSRPLLSVVVTDSTLATPAFQESIARVSGALLLIADEAHNYGSPTTLATLPRSARFRLGLSATPERWMDPVGTAALREYFGSVVFRYGLREAIDDGVLTPYRYHPMAVHLDDDEMETLLEISRSLARFFAPDDDTAGGLSDVAMRLLLRRARLLGAARAKLPVLRSLLADRTQDTHVLVYCGDGRVVGEEEGEYVRQVEEAVRIIGTELRMRCASYTARTPPDRRQQLLRAFDAGDVQVLVAIRCLDEGVDIPSTRTAIILASSTNPRQFVQRRGRVLRRSPGKTRAEIFDLLVMPSPDQMQPGTPEFDVMRRMLRNELRRAGEFAELAENGPVARGKLLEMASHFDLMSVLRPDPSETREESS